MSTKRYTPGSIVELLDRHPSLFCTQSWFRGEAFTRTLPVDVPLTPPTRRLSLGQAPGARVRLPRAVDLLNCYVQHPTDPIWDDYCWTADHDAQGQRIYVGGCANGKGLEIHRHIHLTERFGVPSWT